MSGYVTRDAWSDQRGDPTMVGLRHQRGRLASGLMPGGQPGRRSRKSVPCPRCGARAGERCVRTYRAGGTVGGRIKGHEVGGGYEKPMKGYHDERRLMQPTAAGEERS